MADLENAAGLSGHSVRGAVAESQTALGDSPEEHLESVVRDAVDMTLDALREGGEFLGHAINVASDKAFEGAADVGANIATSQPAAAVQGAFSWSGYFQALGVLCLLLALLWFAVWAIRKYGKFNFLPRPGTLPKDALIMEAQMPLGPKKGLMVVRFLNRRLLLGVTEHQISLLTEEGADHGRSEKSFQGYLDSMHSGSNSPDIDHTAS